MQFLPNENIKTIFASPFHCYSCWFLVSDTESAIFNGKNWKNSVVELNRKKYQMRREKNKMITLTSILGQIKIQYQFCKPLDVCFQMIFGLRFWFWCFEAEILFSKISLIFTHADRFQLLMVRAALWARVRVADVVT